MFKKKLVTETISLWTEDLSGHTEQSFYRRGKGMGGETSGWGRKGRL